MLEKLLNSFIKVDQMKVTLLPGTVYLWLPEEQVEAMLVQTSQMGSVMSQS